MKKNTLTRKKYSIEAAAAHLAAWIYKYNQGKHVSESILNYFLINAITNITVIFSSLFIGIMIGQISDVIIAIIGLAVLRFFSGGHHMNTPLKCILVSTAIVVTSAVLLIPEQIHQTIWILTGVITTFFAPAVANDYVKFNMNLKPIYKLISILIILIGYHFHSEVLMVTFALQSLTLIDFIKPTRSNERR